MSGEDMQMVKDTLRHPFSSPKFVDFNTNILVSFSTLGKSQMCICFSPTVLSRFFEIVIFPSVKILQNNLK